MQRNFSTATNGEYDAVIADMQHSKDTTGHFYINIYTNPEGTVFANDSNGNPINNRLVNYTLYRYSRINPTTNEVYPGFMRFVFGDGSKLENIDESTTNWYSVPGTVPLTVKLLT